LRSNRIRVMNRLLFAFAMMVTLGIALGAPRPSWAQDDEDEGPMSNMRFVVVRDANGKPVKNAAVVLHPVTKKGKQAMGGLELKTDEEGKTWIDGIPYGVLRVQVLAPGFQTFGEDYEIKLPETQITVRLKRPTSQYSVYGASDKDKAKDKKDQQPPAPQTQPQAQQPPPAQKPDRKPE